MIQQTNPKELYKYKEYFNKNFSKNHLVVVGPIDIITFNIKTKEYHNYDVKTVSYRKSATKYAHKKNDRINRSPSKKQKTLNVKIVYVYEDGKILIK